MKIFLSWSGERSRLAAEAFHQWLPDVLQSIQPWMSSEDICSGAGWNQEIRSALNESNFGIIFVTRDNRESPWLMFEAGAIAKHVAEARVVPLLVDDELKPAMLTGPLGQLQAREATKEKIHRLVRDINFDCQTRLNEKRLERCFETNWDRLAKSLEALPVPSGEIPEMSTQEMFAQILRLVRSENRVHVHELKEGGTNQVEKRSPNRLKLRLAEHEVGLALGDKIIQYWETLGDGEMFIDVSDGDQVYRVFRSGDLQLVNDFLPY